MKGSVQARTVGMYEEPPADEELPHEPPRTATVEVPQAGRARARRSIPDRLTAMRDQWRRTRDSLLKRRTNLQDQRHQLDLTIEDLTSQIDQCTKAMGE